MDKTRPLKKSPYKSKLKRPAEHGDKFHPYGLTPAEWKPMFIDAVRESVHTYQACKIAGISRRQAHTQRDTDPEFAQMWEEARVEGIEKMEEKLKQMANEKNVAAIIFWLKAHDSKYRERVHFEIANKIVESVTLEIITVIKNNLPDACPQCGNLLALGPKIAAQLKELSQGLLEKPDTSVNGR